MNALRRGPYLLLQQIYLPHPQQHPAWWDARDQVPLSSLVSSLPCHHDYDHLLLFRTRCLFTRPVSKSPFLSWVPHHCLPLILSLGLSCILQASELGMTSAFYKYILTTMVRTAFGSRRPASTPALCEALSTSFRFQDFPILHLDGIVEDSSNILGFSMFNTSHPFYPEFVRSLNMSWRENCEASTYPGPAVSTHPVTLKNTPCTDTHRGRCSN